MFLWQPYKTNNMTPYTFSPNFWLLLFSKSNCCWNWFIWGNRWRFSLGGDLDGKNWYRVFLPLFLQSKGFVVVVESFSHVQLFATQWITTHQAWDRLKLTTVLENPSTEILRGNFDIAGNLSSKCDLEDQGGAGLGPLLLKLRICL